MVLWIFDLIVLLCTPPPSPPGGGGGPGPKFLLNDTTSQIINLNVE